MALKIFRVCLSSELPPERERQDNYIYLTYDTLTLYLGQNEFYDNFSVSESFPETPVNGMIYLLTSDGSVHRSIDYSDEKLADIEDESQIPNAINYDFNSIEFNALWETQEDLGPVEVYDEDWKLLYTNENE